MEAHFQQMTTEYTLENLQFDPKDPFDLGYHIFDNVSSYLSVDEFENFKYESNKALLEAILKGEMRSKYQCVAFSELMQDEYSINKFDNFMDAIFDECLYPIQTP